MCVVFLYLAWAREDISTWPENLASFPGLPTVKFWLLAVSIKNSGQWEGLGLRLQRTRAVKNSSFTPLAWVWEKPPQPSLTERLAAMLKRGQAYSKMNGWICCHFELWPARDCIMSIRELNFCNQAWKWVFSQNVQAWTVHIYIESMYVFYTRSL